MGDEEHDAENEHQGELTADELVKGVSRLKGTARSLDLALLIHHHAEKHKLMLKKIEEISRMQMYGMSMDRGAFPAEPGPEPLPVSLAGINIDVIKDEAVGLTSPQEFLPGQRVQFCDDGRQWVTGIVTSISPLKVRS